MACRILVAFLILIFSHFPFFPLPWWERIKVRGMLGFPTILASNTKPSTKSWFHPHPDLLPSREKESKSVIARSAATWQSHLLKSVNRDKWDVSRIKKVTTINDIVRFFWNPGDLIWHRRRHHEDSSFESVRISSTRSVIARSAATWQSHLLKYLWSTKTKKRKVTFDFFSPYYLSISTLNQIFNPKPFHWLPLIAFMSFHDL